MRAALTSDDHLQVIQNGLPPGRGPVRKVLVLGAGMAGLTAAYELHRARYEVEILKAQTRAEAEIHRAEGAP